MSDIGGISGGRQYMMQKMSKYTDRIKENKEKGHQAWYERDLSKEEIQNQNSASFNKDSEGADLCRKLASVYQSAAESNRSKYSTVGEMVNAVCAKYTTRSTYAKYTREEREAMIQNEISMTLYGTVRGGMYTERDPHLRGEVSKNTLRGDDEDENRTFNAKTLSSQIMNVFGNNGLNIGLIKSGNYKFSVNGMTKKVDVSVLDDKSADVALIRMMTEALNSKENGKKLFFNLLNDGNQQGIPPSDEFAKYKIYSYFQEVTGKSIGDFEQTKNGFVDKDGNNAVDVFKEAVKNDSKIRPEFKGAACGYFQTLINEAMKYNMAETKDLQVSVEFRAGAVYLNNGDNHLDVSI